MHNYETTSSNNYSGQLGFPSAQKLPDILRKLRKPGLGWETLEKEFSHSISQLLNLQDARHPSGSHFLTRHCHFYRS
jgi:hypothetical protein